MSGNRSTDKRPPATRPKSTTPSVTMKTVTGRWIDPSTSFTSRLEPDRLDAGALLEAALPHGDHAVAGHQPRQDLRGVARDRPDADGALEHRVAARHEHVVLAVLRQHR